MLSDYLIFWAMHRFSMSLIDYGEVVDEDGCVWQLVEVKRGRNRAAREAYKRDNFNRARWVNLAMPWKWKPIGTMTA